MAEEEQLKERERETTLAFIDDADERARLSAQYEVEHRMALDQMKQLTRYGWDSSSGLAVCLAGGLSFLLSIFLLFLAALRLGSWKAACLALLFTGLTKVGRFS